jgi:gamma-glutamyltranspeptidase/glutathione hydrolase
MTGEEAIDAPRSDHEWMPDRLTIEANGVDPSTVDALKAMGHDVRVQGRQGSAHSIWIDPKTGTVFGIADGRDATAKASSVK